MKERKIRVSKREWKISAGSDETVTNAVAVQVVVPFPDMWMCQSIRSRGADWLWQTVWKGQNDSDYIWGTCQTYLKWKHSHKQLWKREHWDLVRGITICSKGKHMRVNNNFSSLLIYHYAAKGEYGSPKQSMILQFFCTKWMLTSHDEFFKLWVLSNIGVPFDLWGLVPKLNFIDTAI